MGTEYYALNEETDEVYQLGKGAWHQITSGENRAIDTSSLQTLASLIGMHWYDDKHVDPDEYDYEIALALQALGKLLVLIDDCSGPDPHDYKLIGSRYRE